MSQGVNLQFYWGKEQFHPVKVVTISFFFNHPLIHTDLVETDGVTVSWDQEKIHFTISPDLW